MLSNFHPLSCLELTDEGLRWIASFPSIQNLTLDDVDLGETLWKWTYREKDEDEDNVPPTPQITQLTIMNTVAPGQVAIREIIHFFSPSLQKLQISVGGAYFKWFLADQEIAAFKILLGNYGLYIDNPLEVCPKLTEVSFVTTSQLGARNTWSSTKWSFKTQPLPLVQRGSQEEGESSAVRVWHMTRSTKGATDNAWTEGETQKGGWKEVLN